MFEKLKDWTSDQIQDTEKRMAEKIGAAIRSSLNITKISTRVKVLIGLFLGLEIVQTLILVGLLVCKIMFK